ncbi:dienelactone hydrolase family protein [Amycolatopsis taiwanensis]|nr:dienelactone hydrolase family protein [Amycolatopsis taiwanensis]
MTTLKSTLVDDIPVAWCSPIEPRAAGPRLALWQPPFGMDKAAMEPYLRELAEAGFTAVSVDPWQHGERAADETGEERFARVFAAFRRGMWPILGRTVLDCMRVPDWAEEELGAGREAVAGGMSLGGDTAVALAGADARVRRVAAIVATPDWTRPGMRDVFDPSREIDQGEAGPTAQWFHDHLCPMKRLDAFAAHAPAIAFELGADDTHVPPEAAARFRDALAATPATVRITHHPGDHSAAIRTPDPWRNSLEWLTSTED